VNRVHIYHACYLSVHMSISKMAVLSCARRWSMDGVNDALFNVAPNVQQAMTQNVAVTSDDVSNTQKKILKLKVDQKYLQIYNTEMKAYYRYHR